MASRKLARDLLLTKQYRCSILLQCQQVPNYIYSNGMASVHRCYTSMISVGTKLHLLGVTARRSISSATSSAHRHSYTGTNSSVVRFYFLQRNFTTDRIMTTVELDPSLYPSSITLETAETITTVVNSSGVKTAVQDEKELEEEVGVEDGEQAPVAEPDRRDPSISSFGIRESAVEPPGLLKKAKGEFEKEDLFSEITAKKCEVEKEELFSEITGNLEQEKNDHVKEGLFGEIVSCTEGGGGEENDEKKERFFSEIARIVYETVEREPEWEQVLLSLFPSYYPHRHHLFHPSCVRKVLQSRPFANNPEELHLRYFHWMSEQECFSPKRSTTTALFRAFAEAGTLKAAMSFVRSTKLVIRLTSIEPFILFLCKNSAFEEALEVFSIIKDHFNKVIIPVPTWNTALGSSVKAGRTDMVWMFYEIMIASGVSGNVFTFECLIEAFCKEGRLLEAFRFIRQVSRSGLVPNIVSFNKLVCSFCKEGDFRKVSDVLHLMIMAGRRPNLHTYHTIIYELCVRGRADEAFRIFNILKDRGYAPGVVMYSTMIDGLCKMQKMADAHKIWQEMSVMGLESNSYTYNALVDGYCKLGNLNEALDLYGEMVDKGLKDSTIICNTLIGGFCQHQRMKDALKFFDDMTKKGIKHDIITFNTMILGFCLDGNSRRATDFFRQLLESGLQPNEGSYNHLVRALSEQGDMQEALDYFADMESKGLKAYAALYDYIIVGFSNVGNFDEGMVWLWKMLHSNLQPTERAFNELINGLSRSSRVDDIFLVLDLMCQFGHSLEGWICQSLIHRLCHDNSNLAEQQLAEILAAAA